MLLEEIDSIAVPPLSMRMPTEKQLTHPITTSLKAVLNAKTKEKLDIALMRYFKGTARSRRMRSALRLPTGGKAKKGTSASKF